MIMDLTEDKSFDFWFRNHINVIYSIECKLPIRKLYFHYLMFMNMGTIGPKKGPEDILHGYFHVTGLQSSKNYFPHFHGLTGITMFEFISKLMERGIPYVKTKSSTDPYVFTVNILDNTMLRWWLGEIYDTSIGECGGRETIYSGKPEFATTEAAE